MTFAEVCLSAYAWLDARAVPVFAVMVAFPLVGTGLTAMLKALRKHQHGEQVGTVIIAAGAFVLVVQVVTLMLARTLFDTNLTDVDVLLLSGPPLWLVGALVGVHLVYPLNDLAAWRSVMDVGWFLLALTAIGWLLSNFRGWGILFGGSLIELALIAAATVWLVRRLFRRAFSTGR